MRCKVDEADSAALRLNVPVVAFEGAIESLVQQTGSRRGARAPVVAFSIFDYKNSVKLKFCFAKDQTAG